MRTTLVVLVFVLGRNQPALGTDRPFELEPVPQNGSVLTFIDGGMSALPPVWEYRHDLRGLCGAEERTLPGRVGRCCGCRSCRPDFRAPYFRQPYDYRGAFDYPWHFPRR